MRMIWLFSVDYKPYIIFIGAVVLIALVVLSTRKPKEKPKKKKTRRVKEKKKTPAKKPVANQSDKKLGQVEEEVDKILSKKK